MNPLSNFTCLKELNEQFTDACLLSYKNNGNFYIQKKSNSYRISRLFSCSTTYDFVSVSQKVRSALCQHRKTIKSFSKQNQELFFINSIQFIKKLEQKAAHILEKKKTAWCTSLSTLSMEAETLTATTKNLVEEFAQVSSNSKLLITCSCGLFDEAISFITKPEDIQGLNRYYNQLLLAACKAKKYPLALFLIEQGAAVDTISNFRTSLLVEAVTRGKSDAAIKLLTSPIAKTDIDAHELLHLAIEKKLDLVAERLIAVGASVDKLDTHRNSFLHHAAVNNLPRTILALTKIDIQQNNNTESSALHLAFAEGNKEAAHALLTRGASLSVLNKNKKTAFECFLESPKWSQNYDKMKALFLEFIRGIHLDNEIWQKKPNGQWLREYITANYKLLFACEHPLNAAFLLNSQPLTFRLVSDWTQDKLSSAITTLQRTFATSDISKCVLDGFLVSKAHIHSPQIQIPTPAQNIALEDLLSVFDATDFGNLERFNEHINMFSYTKVAHRNLIEALLIKIKEKTYLHGAPTEGSTAYNQAYALLEKLLKIIVTKLQQETSNDRKVNFFINFIPLCTQPLSFGKCAHGILQLYKWHCIPFSQNTSLNLAIELSFIREQCLRQLLPSYLTSNQNIHDVNQLFEALGQETGIALHQEQCILHDNLGTPLSSSDKAETLTRFHTHYSPLKIFLEARESLFSSKTLTDILQTLQRERVLISAYEDKQERATAPSTLSMLRSFLGI